MVWNPSLKAGWRQARSLALAGALAGFVCLALPAALPKADDTSLPSANPVQTVFLTYKESPQSVVNWPVMFKPQAKPFRKEPAIGSRKVFRSNLQFGDKAQSALALLWDPAQGKLYLDLNRNQDLTDDPDGVISCPVHVYSTAFQQFTNIHLELPGAAGSRPALLDLSLYGYGGSLNGSAACRSFWEGKVSLQGRDWQVGFVEESLAGLDLPENGQLVLRPWSDRAAPLDVQDGSLEGFKFSRNLFFDGQAYRLDCSFAPQGKTPRYKLTIEERAADLGSIRLTGKFINRLVLAGNGSAPGNSRYTVVLDQPESSVKVPLGAYSDCQASLKAGEVEACLDSQRYGFGSRSCSLTVAAASPATVAVGGPLTNSVELTRHGSTLAMNYRLRGAGGDAYHLLGTRKEPRFAIDQAGKQLASGKFEFG